MQEAGFGSFLEAMERMMVLSKAREGIVPDDVSDRLSQMHPELLKCIESMIHQDDQQRPDCPTVNKQLQTILEGL